MKKHFIGLLTIVCAAVAHAQLPRLLKIQKSVSSDAGGTVYPGCVRDGWDYINLDSPARGYEDRTYRDIIGEVHQRGSTFYLAAVTFADTQNNYHRWYVPARIALRALHSEDALMPGHDALCLIPEGCGHVETHIFNIPPGVSHYYRNNGLSRCARLGCYYALSYQMYHNALVPQTQRDRALVSAFNTLEPSLYEQYERPSFDNDRGDNTELYDVRDSFDGNEEE